MHRLTCFALALSLFLPLQDRPQTPTPSPAPDPEFKDLPALLAALPAAKPKPLNQSAAVLFTALPLTCVDDLQSRPQATRPYFWQPTFKTVDAYDKNRAFYGCNDWATAVSATWTMVTLLKQYPELSSGELIREKLNDHLGRQNLEGELAYYRAAGAAQRPYGYIWFLKLYADLATWKDPDGSRYAENAAPLARYFADGLVGWLVDLERPTRAAGQTNSAYLLNLLLDYVDATRDMTLKRGASDAARRLFLTDTSCATNTEAASPEMVSPCLEEAALMSRVLDQAVFVPWLDKFLPAANSVAFKPLRSIAFDAVGPSRGARAGGRGAASAATNQAATASQGRGSDAGAPPTTAPPGGATSPTPPPATPDRAGAPPGEAAAAPGPGRGNQTNPRTQWIALAFRRAEMYTRLTAALPASDPRIPVFHRLADIHAEGGQKEVVTAAAFDAPWVGALAVSFLSTFLTSPGGPR